MKHCDVCVAIESAICRAESVLPSITSIEEGVRGSAMVGAIIGATGSLALARTGVPILLCEKHAPMVAFMHEGLIGGGILDRPERKRGGEHN